MIRDEHRAKCAAFKAKIEQLCAAVGVPIKHAFVMGSTVTLTFYGEQSARTMAGHLSAVMKIRGVLQGFDPGKATDVRNGRHDDVAVWRVHGTI